MEEFYRQGSICQIKVKWNEIQFFESQEATVNTLIGIEVAMWFFIGECIGKGSLVGYQIPGACHFDAEL